MDLEETDFQVFVAKFTYDPVALSPNENPDLELAFQESDYIFVYGEPDEDGFYEGELMSGKRGLVPSNYIEKVPDEALKEIDRPLTNGYDGDANAEVAVSLEEVVITEIIDHHDSVPPPRDFHLERQLSNSFVVAWQPPEESILLARGINLDSYLLTCNDQPITSVFVGDRTKTLLEKLDVNKSHRVSVRAVATDGRQSCEHLSTITIGKKARLSPSAVEVIQIAKRSATVQWCLASSYLQHRVSVDEEKWVHIMPSGVFKCLVSGLQPNSSHTVNISCIQNTSVEDHCCVSSSVSFVTLPKDFPEPPLDVQVEIGPQKGTLLVTWTPVLKDLSNVGEGVKVCKRTNVTGYNVYIAGKKIRHLSNPFCDHIVLNWKSFEFEANTAHSLTIRTTTDRWESPDSQPATYIGIQLIQEVIKSRPAVFEGDDTLFIRDGELVGDTAFKYKDQDSKNKNINNVKVSSVTKATVESNTLPTIPHTEVFKDRLDQTFEQTSTRIAGRLRNKKVQTSPTLIRQPQKHVEYDKVSSMTLKHELPDGTEDDIYNNIPTIITTPATLNRNIKSEARNLVVGEEDSMAGSDMERNNIPKVRLFVGLFDYYPSTMSPNPECSNEELQFLQGQILKVFGEKDADGFYVGESNGGKGLIPSNMVSEVLVYNPLTAEQLLKDNLALCRSKQTTTATNNFTNSPNQKRLPELPYLQKQREGYKHGISINRPRRMVVIQTYSCDKNQLDCDNAMELCLKQGDRVLLVGEPNRDGFVTVEMGQKKGIFPMSHLRPLTPSPRMPGQKLRGRPGMGGRSLPLQYSSKKSSFPALDAPQRFISNAAYCRYDGNQMSREAFNNRNIYFDNAVNNVTKDDMASLQRNFAHNCNVEANKYQS